MKASTLARLAHGPHSALNHVRLLLPLALLGLLSACNHRVASQTNLDVCALALDPVSTLLQEVPTKSGASHPPSAGYCEFTAQAGPNASRPISVMVMTAASMEPNDLSHSAKLMLAEAEQTYGDPGTNDFGDLAKLAVAFHTAPGNTQQIIIGERGVVMEIGLGAGGFSEEQVGTMVKDVWNRVIANKPSN